MYKRPTLIYNICMFNIFKNHRLLQAIWTSLFKLILQPRKTMKPRILKMGDGSWGIRKLPGIQKMRTRGARTPEKKKVEVSVTVCLQLSLQAFAKCSAFERSGQNSKQKALTTGLKKAKQVFTISFSWEERTWNPRLAARRGPCKPHGVSVQVLEMSVAQAQTI